MRTTTQAAALGVLFGKARRQILGLLLPQPRKAIFLREIVRLTGLSPGATQRELTALVSAGILTRVVDGRLVYFQANAASPLVAPLRQLFGLPGDGRAAVARPPRPERPTRAATQASAPIDRPQPPLAATPPAWREPSVPAAPAPSAAAAPEPAAPPIAAVSSGAAVSLLRAALERLQPRIAAAFVYGQADGGDAIADVNLMVVGRVSFAEVATALIPARAAIAGEISPMVYPADEFRRKLAAGNAFLTSVLEQPRAWVVGDGRAIGLG